jgi:hypothetical protein
MKHFANKPMVGKSPTPTRPVMSPIGAPATSHYVSNYSNPNGSRSARTEIGRPRSVPDRGNVMTKTKIC